MKPRLSTDRRRILWYQNRTIGAKIMPTCQMRPHNKMMTPEFVHEQLGKLEVQVNEMRAALTHTQISLGKIDSLGEMISRLSERYEVISSRNEKTLERIHDRIDVIQKEVSTEIESMRREVREMHESHRESVSEQVNTSLVGFTNHVTILDDRVTKTKEKVDLWESEIRGMTRMGRLVWGLVGAGIVSFGAFALKLYFMAG